MTIHTHIRSLPPEGAYASLMNSILAARQEAL